MTFLASTVDLVTAPTKVLIDKLHGALFGDKDPRPKPMRRMFESDTYTKYKTLFSGPTEIYPGLFLGSAIDAASYQTLRKHNIKYIINVTNDITNHYVNEFTYYQIIIEDNNTESIYEYFDDSYNKIEEFLSKNDGNVLVHCVMGASRSATIVTNYISKKKELPVDDVIAEIRQKRPSVNLTEKFYNDLTKNTHSS